MLLSNSLGETCVEALVPTSFIAAVAPARFAGRDGALDFRAREHPSEGREARVELLLGEREREREKGESKRERERERE